MYRLKKHLSVHRFVHPDEFAEYCEIGYLDWIMQKAARLSVHLTTAKDMCLLDWGGRSGRVADNRL